MHKFRVFVSYSSKDREQAVELAEVLRGMQLDVLWDHRLIGGERFGAEIKAMIRRSHLFIPLLSKDSKSSWWVHQETGYATGVGVPVVPIAIDQTLPEAFIRDLNAIRLPAGGLRGLPQSLPQSEIERRVNDRSDFRSENFVVLETPEERAERLAEFAREAIRLGGGRVRQKGALSSFCLPSTRPIADDLNDVWKRRDGLKIRSNHLYQKLFEERHALEKLAKLSGCSLMIWPKLQIKANGEAALIERLSELRAFLINENFPDVKVVTRSENELAPRNVLIVGDWFYAESRSAQPGAGYDFTFCTWHAPSVLRKLTEFDEEFSAIITQTKLDIKALRAYAIQTVDDGILAARLRQNSSKMNVV
jgi:hypothetical protein